MNDKSFTIKYEVHCQLQNIFNKEMLIKHCLSSMHAKAKLDTYCRNKYGLEYQCIIVISCIEKNDMFDNLFGKGFGGMGSMGDLLKGKK